MDQTAAWVKKRGDDGQDSPGVAGGRKPRATLPVNSKNVSKFLDDLHIKNHGVTVIE
jgi:hypothetical protein